MSKSQNGKLGWIATTERWFFGIDELHKNWLSVHAKSIYAAMCSRPGNRGWRFPPRIPHPKSFTDRERWVFFLVVIGQNELEDAYPHVSPEAYDAIEASVTGRLAAVTPNTIPF